jgi:Baseplate J-like protein
MAGPPAAPGRQGASLFFLTPIALLALTALLLIPHAKIVIALPVHIEQLRAPIDSTLVSLVSTQVAVSRSLASSGRMLVPATQAHGELSLHNPGETLLAIPPGTQFVDPDSRLEFESVNGVWLDPLASAVVEIRAVVPGPRGNLPAGRIRDASGMPSGRVEVQQNTPTTGGRSEWRAAVTNADMSALRESARIMLSAQAEDALVQEASARGMMLVDGSLLILEPHESLSAPVGTPVDQASLTLSARVEARAAPLREVVAIAREEAVARGDGQVFDYPNEDEVRAALDPEGGLVIEFTLRTFPTSLPSDTARHVTLRTRLGAQRVIQWMLPESRVRIESSPPWWPLMPAFPLRIEMVLVPAADSPRVVR